MNYIHIEDVSFDIITEIHRQIPEFDTAASSNTNFFVNRTKEKQTLVIAAKTDDEYVGYVVAYDKYEDGSLYCWMAGVIPAARRQGVLRAMMDYMVHWARRYEYTGIRIKTRNSRRGMLHYLVQEGYDIIGITKHADRNNHRITFLKEITL